MPGTDLKLVIWPSTKEMRLPDNFKMREMISKATNAANQMVAQFFLFLGSLGIGLGARTSFPRVSRTDCQVP